MAVSFDSFNHKFVMNLKGQLSHNFEIGADPLGNIARINHALESMPKPTIHEGVTARIMEQQWNVSERCELNRQIRADNRLLRGLKMELQKIAEAVKTSIPKIAKAMENIFANLIISRYNQRQAHKAVGQYNEWLNDIKPDYYKYNELKKDIHSKKCFLRDLNAERKATAKMKRHFRNCI